MSNSLLKSTPKNYPASLLLNFDEAPFVDSSSYNNTVSNIGETEVGLTTSKFGAYAGLFRFGGIVNRLDISTGDEFAFGTGDFTAECWFESASVWQEMVLFSMGDPTDGHGIMLSLSPGIVSSAGCTLKYSIGAGTFSSGTTWIFEINPLDNVTFNTWHHVAVTRHNGVACLYLDGCLIGSAANSTDIDNFNSNFTVGGRSNYEQYFNGSIDGLRVVKGAALYTGTAYIIPNIPPSKNAVISPKLDNHIVMTSTKSSGDISGYVTTSTGYYTVNWWDGTKTTYTSGSNFSKGAIGGSQNITIYPSAVINSLLLNFNGVNNSTVFTNSSPNNYNTGTVYGNAKISTSQSKFGGSSGYFDGTGDYVQFPYNSIFDLSSGDWTLESWFYAIALPADMTTASNAIISKDTYGANFNWNINVAQNGIVFVTDNAGDILFAYTTISTNTWHHVAIVKDCSYVKIYLNGALVDSKIMTVNNTTTNAITIGCNSHNNPSGFFNGYIDDLRIVKGKALYASNFMPPTSELTSDISFDVIGHFLDINISNNNLTSVRPFYSRFMQNSAGVPGYYNYVYYWANYPYTGWFRNYWIPAVSGTMYQLDVTSNSLNSSALDQLYADLLNGTGSINVTDNIGGDSDNSGVATAKGYTVYGSFAPILSALFNFNGANNSTTFTDSGSYNHVPTRFGNTVISTTQSKFGGASAYFDGTDDYLDITTNSVFAMGKEDFTVECWAYPTSWPDPTTSDLSAIVENRTDSSSGGFLLWLGGDQKWTFYTSANSNAIQKSISSISIATLSTWTHLVGTRRNGKLYLFVNGSLVGSTGIEGTPDDISPSNTAPILIGTAIDNPGASRNFIGYIDGLKIVKGKALYVDDFVVPSSAPTTSTATASSGVTRLLLNCNGTNNSTTFTDSSSAARTVTRTHTVISTTQSKFGGASAYFSNSGTDALAVTEKFNLSNVDYTIEFFFYLIDQSGATSNPRLFSIEKGGESWGVLLNDTTPNFASYNRYGTGTGIDLNNTSFSYATWYHFAMTKDYNTYRFFLNGSLIGSGVGSYTPKGDVVLTIGGCIKTYQYSKLNAYMDDFRVITGKALYTSNFTPPTSQLTTYP